jgi:phage shock protein PspC (stress-responsive transcriptional regulator)
MYDDIEKIRELEEEEEKDQNAKLGSAGMMSLIAGGGLITLGVITNLLGISLGELIPFLQVALTVIGFGALGYGFFKTLQLAFRQKELNFPTLNVYRKTRPAAAASSAQKSAETKERTQSRSRSNAQSRTYDNQRTRTYRQQARTYRRSGRKTLRRSRTNRVFSGVAGGIAEYAGISPALVRFAFHRHLFHAVFLFDADLHLSPVVDHHSQQLRRFHPR